MLQRRNIFRMLFVFHILLLYSCSIEYKKYANWKEFHISRGIAKGSIKKITMKEFSIKGILKRIKIYNYLADGFIKRWETHNLQEKTKQIFEMDYDNYGNVVHQKSMFTTIGITNFFNSTFKYRAKTNGLVKSIIANFKKVKRNKIETGVFAYTKALYSNSGNLIYSESKMKFPNDAINYTTNTYYRNGLLKTSRKKDYSGITVRQIRYNKNKKIAQVKILHTPAINANKILIVFKMKYDKLNRQIRKEVYDINREMLYYCTYSFENHGNGNPITKDVFYMKKFDRIYQKDFNTKIFYEYYH